MDNMDYNTQREKLRMPEYGRGILKAVEILKGIEDKGKRTEQAYAIIKAMEILNPQVRNQEDYKHKLWDHLYMIADYDLDIDAPYPCPDKDEFNCAPLPIPMKNGRIKANHYGRNIEKIIDLVAEQPDGEVKTSLLKALATYMRQQYLIWNKDSVSDETIFNDIVKLSGGSIAIPEGIELTKVASNANFARPSLGIGQEKKSNNKKNYRKGGKNRRQF